MDKKIIELLVYFQDFNETNLEDKYMKFPIRWEIKKNVLVSNLHCWLHKF